MLKDCYVRWPPQLVGRWARRFYDGLDASLRQDVDFALFSRYFDLMGVQRHLKAAGIFARLNHRDGKPDFLRDVPRTLSYIVELEHQYPELDFVIELLNTRCLPALRKAP